MKGFLFLLYLISVLGADQTCPPGFWGKNCDIAAEVATCRTSTFGELCGAINFPDSCDMNIRLYIGSALTVNRTVPLSAQLSYGEQCFKSPVPLLPCQLCLSLTDTKANKNGKISYLCPRAKLICLTTREMILPCFSPKLPLDPKCFFSNQTSTPTLSPSPAPSPNHPEATCIPQCVHGTCVQQNHCLCEKGWKGPYCFDAEHDNDNSPTQASSDGNKNIGLIVVGAIGGTLVLLGIIVTAYHMWKRRAENKTAGYDEMNDLIDDDDEQ